MKAKTVITLLLCAVIDASPVVVYAEDPSDTLTRELNEIVVTAAQPATRLVGMTLVSTIPGSNLATLGNALDVLAQLPMIKVEDNAVSVIGKDDIEIYIDGRPMHDIDELQMILSSNIKRIELDMAPGAAYRSTTGAVIRIVTRRNFADGLSLSEQLRVRCRRKWAVSDMLGLNYRVAKWDIFIDGEFDHSNPVIKGSTTNILVYEGRKVVVGAAQHSSYPTDGGSVKGGFNYSRDDMAFGAYYRYSPERGRFTNDGSEWLDNGPALLRRIDKTTRVHDHLVSAYYENRFAERFLLHFDGNFRRSLADNANVTAYPAATLGEVKSTDSGHSTLWAGKLYLSCPFAKGILTVGTQNSYTRTSLDYRMLNAEVGAYIPSSLTDARQVSASVFASWSRTFGRVDMSAGLRYEYVDYDFKVDGRRDGNVSRRDNLLTPDVSLGYSFNEQALLSLSYKMATIKPPYSQLTGALTYVGRHEIEGGNHALRDERMHDMQLFGMWRAFKLQADFTHSIDTYGYVKQLYPADDLQLLMHPVNMDVSALSAYFMWGKPVGCWTPDVTLGLYRQWLEIDGTKYGKPIVSYYLDNTFALPHGWTVTANINGSSGGDMHTNRFAPSWFVMDASVGKTLLGKSLTLKLSATDIFNTRNNDWTMCTYGVHVDKRQSYDRRGVQFDIIYRFRPRKSAYRGKAASEAEMDRL